MNELYNKLSVFGFYFALMAASCFSIDSNENPLASSSAGVVTNVDPRWFQQQSKRGCE